MQNNNTAFAKKTPSLFVINSPLHVLCIVEAIKEFCIEDYYVVFFTKKTEIRNAQTISMLEHFNIRYIRKDLSLGLKLHSFFRLLFGSSKAYPRVFIPCGLGGIVSVVGVGYLQKKGQMVYIDDGIASIPILKGDKNSLVNKFCYLHSSFLKLICKYKRIELEKYYYTIYSDITTSKITYTNTFANLKKKLSVGNHQDGIYFIGTVINRVCELNGIPLNLFKKILGNLMDDAIKYNPGKKVYYIPHGRDTSSFIVDFCKLHNVEYCHLDEAVELFFVRNNIHPLAVYGYVSTALLNIKMLMPETKTVNWYLASRKSILYENRHNISIYYASRGIEYWFFDVDTFR